MKVIRCLLSLSFVLLFLIAPFMPAFGQAPDFPLVYDSNGVERGWAWAVARYPGLEFLEAPDRVERFELVAIYVTAHPATVIGEVRNKQSGPHVGQPVAFSWPSLDQPADYLGDLRGGGPKRLWTWRAVRQDTDQNGITGFGISNDFYYKVGFAPGTAWVLSPSVDSDGLKGIAMLGGTDHEGPLHLVWQLQDAETAPPTPIPKPPTPDPPPIPETGDFAETNSILRQIAAVLEAINGTLREAFRLPGVAHAK